MILTKKDISQMFDLSCVRTYSHQADIDELIANAKRNDCGHVSVLQCFIPEVKKQLADRPDIKVVGNVSFPSGSDTTSLKIAQAKEMVAVGCDEIDMVMNIGFLRSGKLREVEEDVKAVVSVTKDIPLKVIIEISQLEKNEIEKACEICINAGAAFVKTGTGWMNNGTTLEDIRLLKSIVGDSIKIKASGGIRDLKTLVEMYKLGAVRFGVNLRSGLDILEECNKLGGKVSI